MITNISLVTLYCLDQDKARDFYVDVLGFTPRTDITMGEGFRWVTVGHPSQPELEVTLMTPGPPLGDDAAAFVRGQLEKGEQGGPGTMSVTSHSGWLGWPAVSQRKPSPLVMSVRTRKPRTST